MNVNEIARLRTAIKKTIAEKCIEIPVTEIKTGMTIVKDYDPLNLDYFTVTEIKNHVDPDYLRFYSNGKKGVIRIKTGLQTVLK